MDTQLFFSKIQMLPGYLQLEVADFIDYLLLKQTKTPKMYPLSEEEMEKNMETSTVNDIDEDYVTEKEIQYYLKLKR